ncbi:GNAT family N-acetyltransferase [Microbacterium sp.]|uniref:GNAT family N-acetyltransferase n=1 Tax=Microbacterium sp. TaxID=51671 RepID=UPI0028117DD4|nr:GNAT family N-acetyltransferase [Microbacterium sp.]
MPIHEPNLHIDTLDRTSIDETAALLGSGMADNPVHVGVYGGDDEHRERCHARMTRTLLTVKPLTIEGVRQGGSLVGVAAVASPGACQPSPPARMRLMAAAASLGPRAALRLRAWERAWGRNDPAEPHFHLGPVAVERRLRARGIGTLLLARHASRLDAVGAVGYLETDRPEAIGFYQRFGYAVVGEADVLGVPTWFMRRPPA